MWLGNSREGLCYAIFPGYNVRDNLEIPGRGCVMPYFQGTMSEITWKFQGMGCVF
jgi:hypothetical protein